MQTQTDKLISLKTQLEIVERFESLFASKTVEEFNTALGAAENADSFVAYMGTNAKDKTSQAFDGFNFADDSAQVGLRVHVIDGLKKVITEKTISINERTQQHLSNLTQKNADGAFSFFSLAITAFQSWNSRNDTDVSRIIRQVRDLIAAQKAAVLTAIAETAPKAAAEAEANTKADIATAEDKIKAERQKQATEAAKAFGKKALYHAGVGTLFTVGAGLTTASVLMQFSPAFAVLVGVHLPVAALAALAVTGVAMTAAAAFLVYRSYHQAAVTTPADDAMATPAVVETKVEGEHVATPNPLRAKLVTAGLMTSGLGFAGFSAAMQFSPAFALLTGLQLPPVALIALATVAALLISVAMYRLIKTHGNDPKPVVVEVNTGDEPKQPTDTCFTRVYKSMPAGCLNLFGKKPEDKATDSTLEQSDTATVNA
ncbi:MAG: hypothetical protein NTU48_00605 [Legionellales bacterium]|nr:hypothetical protein [Legionellales bacterium]